MPIKMGIAANGIVTSAASPIRQSIKKSATITASDKSRLEEGSGIKWANGVSILSARSTIIFFIFPIDLLCTVHNGARINRFTIFLRMLSKMV